MTKVIDKYEQNQKSDIDKLVYFGLTFDVYNPHGGRTPAAPNDGVCHKGTGVRGGQVYRYVDNEGNHPRVLRGLSLGGIA